MGEHLNPRQFMLGVLGVLVWALWPLLVLPCVLARGLVAGLREAWWDITEWSPREELAVWVETGRRILKSLRDLWRRKLAGKEPGND